MTREELRDYVEEQRSLNNIPYHVYSALVDGINTLEQESRWIPISEGLPREHEWIGTKQFGTTKSDEVYVTFETPKGDRFTKHLSFQNGKLSLADQQTINAFYRGSVPVAWMQLPEPYRINQKAR